MTQAEELIQGDEPAKVAGVVALIDGCVNDVKRLMANREVVKCQNLRLLVYRLEQASTTARTAHEKMNEVFNSLKHKMAKTPTPEPVTKFCERCDDPNARGKWLGMARLTRIPDVGWPQRSECQ